MVAKIVKSLVLSLFVLFLVTPMSVEAKASQNIKVILDGKEVVFDQPPVVEKGRTLVPVRAIFEAIGMKVGYDSKTKTITADGDDMTITMQVNNYIFSVVNPLNTDTNKNFGVRQELDVPPRIISSRTLVPVGTIFKAIGCEVSWDEKARAVNIVSMGTKKLVKKDNHKLDYKLEKAIYDNNYNEAKQLLEQGANPNSSLLACPLLFNTEDIEMTKLLIQFGGDVNATYSELIRDLITSEYTDEFYVQSIVFDKINYEQAEIVKMYVENGLNLEAKNMWGMTPLEYAKFCYFDSNIVDPPNEYVVKLELQLRKTVEALGGTLDRPIIYLTQSEAEIFESYLSGLAYISEDMVRGMTYFKEDNKAEADELFIKMTQKCNALKEYKLQAKLSPIQIRFDRFYYFAINGCEEFLKAGTGESVFSGVNAFLDAAIQGQLLMRDLKELVPEYYKDNDLHSTPADIR